MEVLVLVLVLLVAVEVTCVVVVQAVLEIERVVPMLSSVINYTFNAKLEVPNVKHLY